MNHEPWRGREKIPMRSYSRSSLFNLFALFILSLSASPAFAQYFTIERFHSDILIREDSSFIVRETIEVTFHQSRRGIYREIPFRYRDEFGRTIATPTAVLSVADASGKPRIYRVSRTGPLVRIRIGDPKRFVSGHQTYVVTYKVENAVLFLEDHDELYWNVTGNDWKAPIRSASAEVHLSGTGKSQGLWLVGYTGHYGSKEEAGREAYENGAKFFARRPLVAGEGLTIVFGWDQGLVSPPPSWKKFLWKINLGENWVFSLPIFSLIFMVVLWRRKGRDPKVKAAVTVVYAPPVFESRPLTPSEAGTLLDEKLDPRDITSGIVGLAVKGYLQIEEVKKEGLIFDRSDTYLKKMKEVDEELSPFEMELMKSLFSFSPARVSLSSLQNKFYKNLDRLKRTLYGELVRKKYFIMSPEKVRKVYLTTGILCILAGGFLLAFFFPFSMGKGFIASALTGLPILLIGRHMPAKTRAGAMAYTEVLGFQEFMNRAEKDRLERMGDQNLFTRFLPYAIALDVVDNWARAFEGIYQASPGWYVSPGGFKTFHPPSFTRSMNTLTSNLGSAMFSAPRGSGGGGSGGGFGGGSSGGGFGGGGGGSW